MTAVNTQTLTSVLVSTVSSKPKVNLAITGTLTEILVEGRADAAAPWVTLANNQSDFSGTVPPISWVSDKYNKVVGQADTSVSFTLLAQPYAQIQVSCAGTGTVTATVSESTAVVAVSGQSGAVVGLQSGNAYPRPLVRSGQNPKNASWHSLQCTLGSGGSANNNWHTTRVAARAFHAIEVMYSSVDGATGTFDHTAVAASTNITSAAAKYTPDQAWNVGPSVAVTTAGGTALLPNLNSTGPIACRSVPRSDGGKYPIYHARTHTVGTLPGYTNHSTSAVWTATDPSSIVYTYHDGSGNDRTSINQANFAPSGGVEDTIMAQAAFRLYYDTVGISVLAGGDSVVGGDSVIDGAASRASYSYRAVRSLQDAGFPIDLTNTAVSGQTWAQYAPRFKLYMAFCKPDVAIISWTSNDSIQTQAACDTQWYNIMNLVEYAQSLNILPLLVTPTPQNALAAGADAFRLQLRDRMMASGLLCVDIEPLVSDRASPARWIPAYVGDGPSPGTHPNSAGNIVIAAELAKALQSTFF